MLSVQVVLGDHDITEKGDTKIEKTINVKKIISHNDYDSITHGNK